MVEPKPEDRIRRALKRNPAGLHIVALAKTADLSRTTVSKYVFAMEQSGEIEVRRIGPSKLVRLRGAARGGVM